jgi:hypothetical protein
METLTAAPPRLAVALAELADPGNRTSGGNRPGLHRCRLVGR